MLESRFEVSTVVVGDGREEEEEVHETKVLNRIIRTDHDGWHYEGDQRHGELIVKALNLQEAKSAQTPVEDEKSWQEGGGGPRVLEQPGRKPVFGRWRREPTTSLWTARTSSTRSRRYAGR